MEDKSMNHHDPLEGVTADGMIVTGAHRSRFAREFSPVLDKGVEQVRDLGEEYSLYVYGSVATGTARVGYSDVDLVTVGLDAPTAKNLGKTLSAEFNDLCRSVEVGPGQSSEYVGFNDENYGNRIFLRHYCVHLAGPDISADLPEFSADEAAARGFNGDIGVHSEKWRAELLQGGNLVSLGRRIARKTLLAISGLVSIYDRTWTTDRVAAAQRWREIVPELGAELEKLLDWSNTFSLRLSDEEVRIVLDGIVTQVVDDFAQQIGLWNH